MPKNLLVIGDSLSYHGPDHPHPPTEQRLWVNVAAADWAADLAEQVQVDLVARLGWTSRDAWWALTKDPYLWGDVAPRADALVLAVGGMDHLPASIPTYLRDGIPYVRPAKLRRKVRDFYHDNSPKVIKATGGGLRQLPQAATDHYLARITAAIRVFNPEIPVILLAPGQLDSPVYPTNRHHVPALVAATNWAAKNDATLVPIDRYILPSLIDGTANPDGIHYSWRTHEQIGRAVGGALAASAGDGNEGAS